ncbi:MAG: hypothetical protein ACT6FF_03075 [Methanosarcinaceae archaeon]
MNSTQSPARSGAERDRTHAEQVERWANFVKTHPRSVWIKQVGPLVDSQIIMANRFYERLSETEGGLEKIRKLRSIGDKRDLFRLC